MGFGVWSLGFGVEGSVKGLGFVVQGLGLRCFGHLAQGEAVQLLHADPEDLPVQRESRLVEVDHVPVAHPPQQRRLSERARVSESARKCVCERERVSE